MAESIRLAVGYARVSLEEENVENQVRAIEDYARANALSICLKPSRSIAGLAPLTPTSLNTPIN